MNLFPIGAIDAGASTGAIEGITYSLFEPNNGCFSTTTSNILTTRFMEQTLLTRKKSEPYLIINYSYDKILNREYNQLEHFVEAVAEDALNSFYTVDWSRGQTPTGVSGTTTWTVLIDSTRFYSSVQHLKAHYALLWNGTSFKLGTVTTVTANTSVALDVSDNYGSLTVAQAASGSVLYPVYDVYCNAGVLSGFKPDVYIPENINLSGNGGHLMSGDISLVSKYRMR